MKHISSWLNKPQDWNVAKPHVAWVSGESKVYYIRDGQEEIPSAGYEYVDLGLPSGLKWATCNVGATSPEEYGDYFMWGSVTPDNDNSCEWANAPFNNGSEDFDETYFNEHKLEWLNGDVLKPEYDAAHVIMGGDWRMPTHDDFMELVAGTNSEWVEDFGGSGVNGRLFTSNANGNTLFIPASGCRWDTPVERQGYVAFPWSSSLYADNPYYAWTLFINSDYIDPYDFESRFGGFSVRGVKN